MTRNASAERRKHVDARGQRVFFDEKVNVDVSCTAWDAGDASASAPEKVIQSHVALGGDGHQ